MMRHDTHQVFRRDAEFCVSAKEHAHVSTEREPVYFGIHAARSALWLANYRNEWGNIISGQKSDAFITEASQRTEHSRVNDRRKRYVREYDIDHARSMPGAHDDSDEFWGDRGPVAAVARAMEFYDYEPVE